MTDYERFAVYWEQAVNGLSYRLSKESFPLLTQAQIQAIWKDELLTKRFFSAGIKHGAAVFLDELAEVRPEVAEAVIQHLNKSEMPLGLDRNTVANAGLAIAGLATACIEKLNIAARLASLAVGGTFTVKTAQDAAGATKSALQDALEKESAAQLISYKALLEDAQ